MTDFGVQPETFNSKKNKRRKNTHLFLHQNTIKMKNAVLNQFKIYCEKY